MRFLRTLCIMQLVCALSLLTTGCTSMHRASLVNTATQPPVRRVEPGDTVRLTMQDGRRVQFRVQAADADGIVASDGSRYAGADITSVERRQVSWLKTTMLGLSVFGGALLVVGLVAVRPACRRMVLKKDSILSSEILETRVGRT